MLVAHKESLQEFVGLIDNIAVDPDVDINYFIPGVMVTTESGQVEDGGPFIEFTYSPQGQDPHVQHVPLTHNNLEKEPQDLVNLFTFSLERFMEEIDSRQYGAQ